MADEKMQPKNPLKKPTNYSTILNPKLIFLPTGEKQL
jgi:hypothetical protein